MQRYNSLINYNGRFDFLIFSILFSTFCFVFCNYIFRFQIGGYDMSPLIDLSYRIHNHEVPYRDFINTFPMAMLAIIKVCSFFLKDGWFFLFYTSYIHYLLIISILNILYFSTKEHKYKTVFYILFQIVVSIPLIVTNHIYHSSITQLNAAILILIFYEIVFRKNYSITLHSLFFIFFGLTFFSKQNISLLLCPFLLVIVLLKKKDIGLKNCALLFLGGMLSILFFYFIFYALFYRSYSIHQFLGGFLGCSGRAIPSRYQISEVFIRDYLNALTIMLVATTTLIILPRKKTEIFSVGFIYFLGLLLINGICILTDWDVKMNNISVTLIANLIFVIFITDLNRKKILVTITSIVILFLFSVYLGEQRYRMKKVGYGAFYEKVKLEKVEKGYLKELYSTPKFIDINNEIEQNIIGVNKDKIFFGPRMEWGYAQFNLVSPLKMPLWWHPGSSYPLKYEGEIINTFVKLNFDVLILLKEDHKDRIPTKLLDLINSKYLYRSSKYLDIYYKSNLDLNGKDKY